jgi:hypothetical protein
MENGSGSTNVFDKIRFIKIGSKSQLLSLFPAFSATPAGPSNLSGA